MKHTTWQEFMAEALGSLVLNMFGLGVMAMVILFGSTPLVPGEVVKGGYTNIVLGWGLAVTMGVFVSAQISGAHLNPAVTLALAVTRRFSWAKVPHYVVAQFVGAFVAAALVFTVYHAQWIKVDPELAHTAGVLSTFPAVSGFWPGFIDQLVGTALLMVMVLAIGDHLKTPSSKIFAPVVLGLLVVAIGASFGGMHGFAVNPARDLAPRLFSLLAGFQNTGLNSILWLVPVVGPLAGALVGAWIYDFSIGKAMNQSTPEQQPDSGRRLKAEG